MKIKKIALLFKFLILFHFISGCNFFDGCHKDFLRSNPVPDGGDFIMECVNRCDCEWVPCNPETSDGKDDCIPKDR